MMTSIAFYLLFYICIVLQGGGTMFINNIGQIIQAVQQDERAVPRLLVIVFWSSIHLPMFFLALVQNPPKAK